MRPTILVIDDSPITLGVVADVLERRGYRVETSDQPLAYQQILTTLRPDLLVLDISMPGLDGPSLLRLIQDNHVHDCPVLLFSDCSHGELTQTIRACGADGGAVKTADCSELVGVIGSVLASRGRAPRPQA